jgi:dihydropteroate synthase
VAQALVTFALALTLLFVLMRLAPGDPIQRLEGDRPMSPQEIARLRARFGLPVMVSPSRKSFLRALTGRDLADISPATLAAELHAARRGVDFIRTHDVRALADALKVAEVLRAQEHPELANDDGDMP